MTRIDGRKENELRPVAMTTGFVDFAEGSVLIQCGRTKVQIGRASCRERVSLAV